MNLPPQYRSQLNTLLQFTQQKDLRHGRALHAHILRTGSLACTTVANGLISFYAKCGDLINAKLVFNSISLKDVVSWNCLINGYSQRGLGGSRLILELFQRMRAENELPDFHTFSGVFTAASKGSDTSEGQQVHTLAIKMASFHDVFVGSSLLNMYCKVGLTADARKVFDRMPERNSVSWATMLSGYASRRLAVETLGLFESMRREGEVETEFVFTSVLSALAAPEFIETGRQLHGAATKDGILSFVSVGNALLTMYSKCGGVEDARRAFQTLSDKDSITWSAMITGFAQSGESHKALSLFSDMHSSGVEPCDEFTLVGVINACSDIVALDQGKQLHGYALRLGSGYQMYVMTALVDMYAKCGCTDDARKGFDYLQEPDTVLWTSMIGGYAQNGENEDALYLYCRMQMKRIAPNELTIVNVLKACSSLSALEQGKQIHASIVKFGLGLEVCMGSALSAMYTKCGSLDDGELVFRKMLARDVVSWNAMISGFAQNGLGDDALKLFDEMILEGTKPDSVTFVNILSACSHMGSVDRAWSYFNIMMGKFGIAPGIEHYACMVDVLSRAGKLNEAKDFIESAQVDHGLCLWRTLLSACKNHHSYELGAYAGEKLMKLGTPESSAYVQLSSIYAALGKREDVDRVRSLMKTRGVAKEPGCSWIELKSGVHVFLVGDQMHPEIEEIQSLLRILSEQMEDDVQEEKALAASVFDLSSSSGFLNSNEEDIVEARRRSG